MASFECNNSTYDSAVQKKLDASIPWVGLYITAASAVCSLAMATDAFLGFRTTRLWLPCKYFSLNAFSLTLLAIAMKLPLDLTSLTLQVNDNLARVSSLALISTAMANLMTSLGSMTNNEIILNLAALAILVITITGNVLVHIVLMSNSVDEEVTMSAEEIGCIVVMLLLLLILCSSAMMVPHAKKNIDSAYREMHKRVVSSKQMEWGEFSVGELRIAVRRYWVMAQTGSSQFVIARSVTCVASALMCLSLGLTLLQSLVRILIHTGELHGATSSNYKWSVNWILIVQSIGVVLGAIAPLMRWFIAAQFKSSKIGHQSLKDEFKVEIYWTKRLVYWRERAVPLQRRHVSRKLLQEAKLLLLSFCIGVQILIVLASKLALLMSALFLKGLVCCFHPIKNLKGCVEESPETGAVDYSRYVLLLEGEAELPQKTLATICNEVDKLIQRGIQKQPKNLIQLLNKSVSFNGVREFDTDQVSTLHSHQEPPNCWSLPIVTLTSIMISLPNIPDDHNSGQLLRAVSEGLYFVRLIEESLERNVDLKVIRHAANVVWEQLELYRKWLDNDLQSANLRGRSPKETLQKLSDIAERIVADFTTDMKDPLMQNPFNWPVKVIAARSMYRVTQTILLSHKDDEELFERLATMISDILAACLTNLVCVITSKCHSNAIEEREESVSKAAVLLGQSEGILEMLQKRGDLPSLDPRNAANIEEWRASLEQDKLNQAASSCNGNADADPHSDVEQVSIEIEG